MTQEYPKIEIPDFFMGVPVNQETLDRALRKIDEKNKNKDKGLPLLLDNLEIEQKSPREGKKKKLFTYVQSLESLKQRKYERHLRPSEAFKLIIDSLENPNSQYQQIKEDMLSSYGEWLSLAMLRKDKETLICYLDPQNLVWDGSKYIINGNLNYSQERQFKIDKSIKSKKWTDLNKFPDDLIGFLYSRKYEDLPQVVREGTYRLGLWLPQEGIIRHCGRGGRCDGFLILASYSRASRGVRERR